MLFQIKCQRCHPSTLQDVGRGPNLYGVVGRYAASLGYKKYSEQLKKSRIFWTRDTLRQYMHDPKKTVPGTLMFYGAELKADAQTNCIIAYLESISPGHKERIRKYKKDKKQQKQDEKKIRELGAHPEVPLFGEK